MSKKGNPCCLFALPSFRQFQTVFHISSIFLPSPLTKLVSFPEMFQDENV